MAYTDYLDTVQEAYIAYYQRPADPEGLVYWATRLDSVNGNLDEMIEAFANSAEATALYGEINNDTIGDVIDAIYMAAFNREADAGGKQFYMDGFADGTFTSATIMLNILDGAQNEDAVILANKLDAANTFTAVIDGSEPDSTVDGSVAWATYNAEDEQAGRDYLAEVGVDASDIPNANEATLYVQNHIADAGDLILNGTKALFTLQEIVTETTTVTVTVGDADWRMMWGDPECDDCNIPADAFFGLGDYQGQGYLQQLLGADIFELAGQNIDIGADTELTSFGIVVIDTEDEMGDGPGVPVELSYTTADGEQFTAELELGLAYLDLLDSVLYYTDPVSGEKLSRFTYKDFGSQESVSETTTYTIESIMLTETVNNGGTIESGFTSALDNIIVAGRLDLLHTAYIDAGEGFNTLEIDAKGYFAQPQALLNIQHINIENLPNVYTDRDGDDIGDTPDSTYPELDESYYSSDFEDSIIDLSRAIDLQGVTITEGAYDGLDDRFTSQPGTLTVTGVRADAVLTLEGGFTQDVTVHYSEGMSVGDNGLDLVLRLGDTSDMTFNILHNAATVNIDSQGGGNAIDANFGTSSLMNMNISGDARLQIANSLADNFQSGTPAVIDASANTAGVDLNMDGFDDEIHFIGTAAADDQFHAHLDGGQGRNVTIDGGDGNGEYDVDTNGDIVITVGNGDNEIEATSDRNDSWSGDELEGTVTVTAGDGQNDIYVESSDAFAITAGDGDNRIEASGGEDDNGTVTEDDVSTIVVGDGQNEIDASSQILVITTGDGVNEIDAYASNLTIMTGAGDDVISAAASEGMSDVVTIDAGEGNNTITVADFETVNVTAGAGDDALTIIGGDVDFGSEDSKQTELSGENGNETMITVDLGAGTNTVTLGSDDYSSNRAITAMDGSSITGENLTLIIQSDADLSRADISGVTAVELGNADDLTLTLSQFMEMGGSTAFSVIGESFNAHSHLNIIVDQSISLDALDIESLPRSIDLSFEIMDGVQLEMTAQQLHERVIANGVTLYDDAVSGDANYTNGDFANGSVLITGAGVDFDPFNSSDQTRTADAGSYLGGSLSDDFGADLDTPADGVQRDEWGTNVLVDRVVDGYNRPADAISYSRIVVDTDALEGGELMPFDTIETFLRIVGDSGMTFTPVEGGIDEWGRPIPNAGDSIELATDTDKFMVDFSSVGGEVVGLTLEHFEKITQIYGNASATMDARVDVKIAADVATDEEGLISSGVDTFVVVETEYESTPNNFYTCATTKGLETLGIQGMYTDQVNFMNTERGVDFLMEVEYSKSEGYVVGTLYGEFARTGAEAVVNVVGLDALPAGETQMVAGIELENADTVTINVAGGNTVIESYEVTTNTDENVSMTVTADANLVFPEIAVDTALFDASGVVGTLVTSMDPEDSDIGMVFVGAEAGTTLTIGDAGVDAIDSISGVGEIALVIGQNTWPDTVNLSEAVLSNVTSVTLNDNTALTLTMGQADAIGAANFVVAEGDTATLNLLGLSDQEFALANYDVDGTLNVTLTLANDPVVTLHPNTDLTGIAALVIPEGTTLELTMEQFQQLDGDGTLTGAGSVHIYDVTQADVGESGADLDLDDVDLTGTDSTVTVTLAESVDLSEADLIDTDPSVDTFNFGDDMTLTLGDIQNADGVAIVGGTNSTLKFADLATAPFEDIDASGFAVTYLMFTNTLTDGGNRNIDDIFTGLAGSIEKVAYAGKGYVEVIDQVVTVEAGITVTDSLTFNPAEINVELNSLTLNMMGGTEIDGNLRVSTDDKYMDNDGSGTFNAGDTELIRSYLQSVTINSDGTDVNLLSGVAANVITGDVTPDSFIGGQDNNLLNLTINASQDFIVEGDVVFNSNVGGDGDSFASNDIEDAIATMTVNGTADVTIGGLDTSDGDVDGLNVINNGTGTLDLTIDSSVDAGDALSFTGNTIVLTVEDDFDLSDDVITGVTGITIDDSDLTLSFTQFTTLGVANVVGTDTGTESLIINGYDGSAFDFTNIDSEIESVQLVLDGSDVVLAPGVNLTGVDSIDANGGSITMTAEQFQQLDGTGTITNAVNVTIQDLTQTIIDDGAFDLTNVTASGDVTVEVTEDVNLSIDDNIENATLVTIAGFHLGLATHAQADDLVVSGDAGSIVTLLFDINYGVNGEIEASGYDVGTLRAIAATVAGLDVEVVLDNLSSDVELNLYETAEEVGYVSAIHRIVNIEDGVAVPGDLIFNGQDDSREMRTLTINFEGDANDGRTVLEDQDGNLEGSVIQGDLVLDRTPEDPALTPVKLQTLTLNSFGDGDSNGITGDITPMDSDGPGTNLDNNLLNVVIDAASDFTIGGDIIFSSTDATDATATYTQTGAADVSMNQMDVSDTDVDALVVNNDGTGTLTITGSSPAIIGPVESVTFSGTGNIVLGTTGEGITDDTISVVDASGLSGDLTMDVVDDVDDADFTFTSGTGVTTMTYSEGDAIAAYDVDTAPGILLDFTNAATGSELHLDTAIVSTDATSKFTVLADADTTIYIDATMDLSGFDASLPVGATIVVADGVTLTLTAAQADNLTIIGESGSASTGLVNLVMLGSDPVDFSGISADIAGTVTINPDDNGDLVLEHDVTLDAATNLGAMTVELTELADGSGSLVGQTIRFNTVDQADNAVIVGAGGENDDVGSTNVVWLFDSIGGTPVDTSGYDPELGRLWVSTDLIDSESGDVEQLFTTLPSTILRADFGDITELDILLSSAAVDRIMEITNFNTVGDLTFSDTGLSPVEHLSSLTMKLGGEVTVGNIVLDDIIGAPGYDPATVVFNGITIESHRAVHTDNLLASEGFVNNNDGTPDAGEHAQPINMNTVGDISVGADNGIDLLDVTLNTGAVTVIGDTSVGAGADLTVGTITFETDTAGSTATLTVAGGNKITSTAVDASDADISVFTMDTAGLTGTGAFDPVAHLDNTEEFIITDSGATSGSGSVTYDEVEGNELSLIDASASDENITMTISQIDSNDDDTNADTIPDQDAFTYDASTGVNTIVVDAVGTNVPTLEADSTWNFDFTGAAAGSTLTIGGGTVFEANSNLNITLDTDVTLYIDGAVDLSEVNLTITGGSIAVPAGMSLTLTLDQIDALHAAGVDILGSGTVFVVGDATDHDMTTSADVLQTMTVDYSGVTMDTVADADGQFAINFYGAEDDAGNGAVQTIIGTDYDDFIDEVGSPAAGAVVTGGLGDDTVDSYGGGGTTTFNVDAGTDAIGGMWTDMTPPVIEDVLVVSAGATANVTVSGGSNFVATADTMNAGTANIAKATGTTSDTTLDLSLAGGPNGYNLTGSDEAADAIDTLTGSEFDDVINGGNSSQTAAGAIDVLTGNGGADIFQFNVDMGNTTAFSQTTTQIAIDREILQVTAPAAASGTLTVNYTVNGAAFTVDVAVLVGDTVQAVATKIAQELQTNGSFIGNAAVDVLNTDTVVVTAQTGQDIELQATTVGATGVTTNEAEGIDVAQVVELTATGAPTAGDNYSALVDLNAAGSEAGTYTAAGGDAASDVVDGLATNYGTPGTVDAVNAVVGDDVIEFVDQNADDGGFTLAVDTTAAFGGSGASDSGLAYTTADIVTDFVSSVDKIEFHTETATDMQAGSGANYLEAAEVADYATALTNANTEFTTNAGTLQYYMTSATDLDGVAGSGEVNGEEGAGLLFFDANLDGVADGVIVLTGVTSADFAAFDITVS